ncbi:hypothetical protein ACJJTC_009288 [Scirpophaga incertulas]
MPKRKSRDNLEYLSKKIRKLERKIRRKTRGLSTSSSEEPPREREDENLEEELSVIDVEQSDPTIETSQQLIESNDIMSLDEPSTSASIAVAPDVTEPTLDKDIMDILGCDPTIDTKYGKDINSDLAIRLQHYSTVGITKEGRKDLCEKYLIPSNCKLIDAPLLNAEIKAALTDIVAKRDKYIENRQKQLATTLSCLSEALSLLFSASTKDTKLIKLIMDATRNLCDCQYNDSVTRRNFILSTLKKDMKEQLQNTKLSNFLFGDNLLETIKAAKAINRSGADLKASVPLPKPIQNKNKQISGSSKNWKASFPPKKPPGPGASKTKESALPPRSRPSTSYKQSQPRPNNTRR